MKAAIIYRRSGMSIILFILLLSNIAYAQTTYPALIYSQHTRLGMNGRIKQFTTYKYTRLKYSSSKPEETTGQLYSVIKNWYDTSDLIVQDSTAIYYNSKSAIGYCKTYHYDQLDHQPVIYIDTRFDCMPPYDNHAIESTVVTLTNPDDSTVLAREYKTDTHGHLQKAVLTSYRFTINDSLITRMVFYAIKKGHEHAGTTTYQYDEYRNFSQTTLKIGESVKDIIHHKIFTIDDYGNALRMLNYLNDNSEPEFMTVYEYEYYE